MRKTRFMTWFFVVLSFAFLCVRDFRVALEAPLVTAMPEFVPPTLWDAGVLGRLYTLERYVTLGQFRRLASDAERRGDGQFMAFAALHLPEREMRDEVLRLADAAVAKDPKLTWVYLHVAGRLRSQWESAGTPEQLRARMEKLRAWDAENAASHLVLAELVRSGRGKNWPSGTLKSPVLLNGLAQQVEWLKAMEAAFARSRYDEYHLQWFLTVREVMMGRGWNHPVVVSLTMAAIPVPNLLNIREYTDLRVHKLGSEAEAAGRLEEALRHYGQVARFGELMRLESRTLVERRVGAAVQIAAYERLAPALKKARRESEAATVDNALRLVRNDLDRQWNDPLGHTSNYYWSWLLVNFWAALTWVFLALTLIAVAYVNAKQWFRREKRGHLYNFITIAENYLAIQLFIACFGLHLAYTPYAQNFSFYMKTQEAFYSLDLLIPNSFPFLQAFFGPIVPLANPFRAYAAYALPGVILVVVALILVRWRQTRKARTFKQESS